MNIAITSQNFRTITGHAGKARRFLVYSAAAGQEPQEIQRLDLPKDQCFHEWHGSNEQAHPTDIADVIITAGSGEGFVKRLAGRGKQVLLTSETDPVQAVKLFLQNQLPTISPEAHEHGHDEHHHAH